MAAAFSLGMGWHYVTRSTGSYWITQKILEYVKKDSLFYVYIYRLI